jgi:hypothetical protein
MKKLNYKLKVSTISLTLLLAVSAMFVTLPSVTAQTGEKMTYAFIGAIPDPVGVNQVVLLHVGITQELQTVAMGWEGLYVTIQRPDGETVTIEDIRTDATGGTTTTYTPDMAGTYYIQTHFPAQVTTPEKGAGSMFTGYVPTGTMMLASESDVLELTVQEDPIPYYPGQSKPNEYWTRPIDAQLREWSTIAGSWMWGAGVFGGADVPNRYAPYNDDAPDSAHVLWTTPFTIGGVAGGSTGDHGIECGDAYEGKWGGSLVLCGKLYYKTGAYDQPFTYHCVDIHTGEEQWARTFQDGETLDFAQLFYWDSYNYHGVFPYLYVATGGGGFFFGPAGPETWTAYDPFTGEWRFTIENVPAGTKVIGPNGEFFKFDVDLTAGRLAVWNMTAAISNAGSWGSAAHLQTHDGDVPSAWTLDVPIPTDLPGSVQSIRFGDKIVGGSVSTTQVTSWAISLEPGNEGTELYRKTWTAPASWALGNETVSWYGTSIEEGVFVVWSKETRQYYGFSTDTGEYLWTTDPQYYLDFHVATECAIVYGKLYSCGVSGIVYAYDLETGDRVWTYEATDPYQEILWTNNWWTQIIFITDGKLYIGHSEHSVIDPKPRGAPFQCINATDGTLIWRVDGMFRQTHWGGTGVIGDSIFATQDSYDQSVYAVGKGPSEITASINTNVVPKGSAVLVDGTIMDVSPGTKDDNRQLRFSNGVPAVSDECMSEWMLYVYKQFSRPADATGVTIKFAAVDPNNNYIELGDTVSDSYGSYGFEFTPDTIGQYMIIATFEGSNSYYPSTATTYLNVVEELEAFPDVPTAEEIAADAAQRTIAMLPPYPDVPTQEQIADDAARRTIAMLPQYPEYTATEIPAYQTTDIVIIVLIVVVIVLMLYIILKKQK